jgi:hypothetical protein
MKNQKMLAFLFAQIVGILIIPAELRAQTPPSQNCPNVAVSFASSAAYAPLTATGVGAPRICLPQCSTSVASCSAGQQTTITPTFSGSGLGTISNRTWTVEGDIAIVGPNNGATVVIYSTLSNTAPFQYGKGRLKLTYTNLVGACACIGFVTLDVFKRVNPLPTTQIVGPNCVSIGEQVTYSIAPDFSRNANVGIGIDNNYRWTPPTGFNSTPVGYLSGDNSSRTWTVGTGFTTGSVSVVPASNTADSPNGVLGTGCNNLSTSLTGIGRKAGVFTLGIVSPGSDYSGLTGNNTIAPSICLNAGSVGAASQCTLQVTTPEAGVTYSITTAAGINFVPLAGGTSWRLEPTGTASGEVTIRGTVTGSTCGSTSATFTLRRGLTAANTLTCINCPPANAGVVCLLQNTAYTFQLNGVVPQGTVSNANIGIAPAGLTSNANFNTSSNQLTFTTNSVGGATLYNVGLSNVTCSNGAINNINQYRVAPNANYNFAVNPVILQPTTNNCGQFRMRATGFPAAGCVQNNYTYTWTHSAGAGAFVGAAAGCGLFTVTVNAVGTLTCVISQNPTGTCSGPCTAVCENFTPQTRVYTVTAADLTCQLPGGGSNPNRAVVSENDELDSRFDLVPNPVSDVLNLIFENEDPERLIIIRELNGKIVDMQPAKETKTNINTVKLPKGTYFCTVKSGTKVVSKKFVKM